MWHVVIIINGRPVRVSAKPLTHDRLCDLAAMPRASRVLVTTTADQNERTVTLHPDETVEPVTDMICHVTASTPVYGDAAESDEYGPRDGG